MVLNFKKYFSMAVHASVQVSSVQSLSCVRLFVTPWIAARQASLSISTCLLWFNHSVLSGSFRPHGLQHTRLPCPSLSPGVCSDSCTLSQWCSLTISSSAALFSFCLQSFPGSFPVNWLFSELSIMSQKCLICDKKLENKLKVLWWWWY